ncbi:hypothetical protein [Kitasatospora griseola]|uniref:hypothetical protein n=1 Tax=Kitasatospora griseola TaxID=2064 RepID=UPI00343F03ED
MTTLGSLPLACGRSVPSLLATGAAGAVALATWGLLLTDLGPSLDSDAGSRDRSGWAAQPTNDG